MLNENEIKKDIVIENNRFFYKKNKQYYDCFYVIVNDNFNLREFIESLNKISITKTEINSIGYKLNEAINNGSYYKLVFKPSLGLSFHGKIEKKEFYSDNDITLYTFHRDFIKYNNSI